MGLRISGDAMIEEIRFYQMQMDIIIIKWCVQCNGILYNFMEEGDNVRNEIG